MRRFQYWHKYFSFLLISVMLVIISNAQDTTNTIGQESIASPNAASLGKYGDYPVSYNTGLPQINIPIYTVESGSLKLPISLSYHASGLKVLEQASWVGAGWALNAGGVITRTVVGAPDDRGIASYSSCLNGYYSDYGFNSYQFIPSSGQGVVNGMAADDQGFEHGVKDAEPDLYFFNFGNYTGKFYFNDDRTPILLPEEDFKIIPDLNNGNGSYGFIGFTVITPDGVRYYFGQTKNSRPTKMPIEITTPSSLQDGPNVSNQAVSSWYLNKIISADGRDSIFLTYQVEQYSYYTMGMFPIPSSQASTFMSISNNGYNVIKNFVAGVRLDSIYSANGNVAFIKNPTPRSDLSSYVGQSYTDYDNTDSNGSFALGAIAISDNHGFCKKHVIYTSYFSDPNPNTLNPGTYGPYNIHTDAKRLRLDSIQELSCDQNIRIPPYRFTYFPELVPRKLSFGTDHWGFSNGVLTNQAVIPTYTFQRNTELEIITGANRDAAWPAMRGGSLQKISFPTGGSTTFIFEPNDTYVNSTTYSKVLRVGLSAGYDGSGRPDTVQFTTSAASSVYEIQMSTNDTSAGKSANLQMSCGGNYQISNHPSALYYWTPAPNISCQLILYPNGYTSGKGANANIVEQVQAPFAGNEIVGGLRINTITKSDAVTANDNVTTFSYTNGGSQSSGILYSRPVYVQSIRNDIWAMVYHNVSQNGCLAPDFGNPLGDGGNYYMSGVGISPLSTIQGNHIGYNQVQVSQPNNGYSIYRYNGSNVWDNIISDVCTRYINTTNCPPSIPNFPGVPDPYEINRGTLKYEGHFRQDGHPLKDASYTYTYSTEPISSPGIKFITVPGLYSYTPYNLQSAKKQTVQVVATDYDPNAGTSITKRSVTYYGSNVHHQPTRTVETTSNGDSLSSNSKYAFDYRIASCDAIPDSLPYYNAMLVNAYDTLIKYLTPSITDNLTRNDTFQVYRRMINLARIQYINYRRRSYSDPGNILSTCYLNAEVTADTLLRPILKLQDAFDNASIETSSFRNLNLLHASYIKYDSSVAPLPFLYPARSKLINLQGSSSSFTNSAISAHTITRDSRYMDESVLTFNGGRPAQVTGHGGLNTAYLFDYHGTLPVAKVTNSLFAQMAATSFEADGNGNWTFTGIPTNDATSPTGSSCYNLGQTSGSISKPGLSSAGSYIISYWTKNASALSITGTQAGYPVKGKTIGLWTYYEHKITGQTTATVSGTGYIDELRLYPFDAQMTTYTYNPVVGMTASCDVDNKITYYIYDGLGRLAATKDQDGNIIKTIQYHYQGINSVSY